MKKIILTLLVATINLAAFAQGHIRMENDSNHLLYFSNFPKLLDDAALAGQLVTPAIPSGATILVDLYGGTTIGSMTLQTTASISASTLGRFGPVNFTSPNLPGGVTAFMQIQIRELGAPPLGPNYFGFSPIFTFTPSSTIAFNSIVNAGGTALSTWTAGNYSDLDVYYRIAILPVPEPSSLALTGLGISALLLRRGLKSNV